MVLQIRTKVGTDRERLGLVGEIGERCRAAGAICLVNDRVDLALAGAAHGVHLGADDLPLDAVRAIAGTDFVIGGTARDPAMGRRLVAQGADYLGVGPVWSTTTKTGLPDPIGLDRLRSVAASVHVPVVAISGVNAERIPEALGAGASGVAVIGAVTMASDPAAATRELIQAFGRELAR